MKSIIIASTSTLFGSGYLEYLSEELKLHFKNAKTILFIPYARPGGISHDEYTEIAALAFKKIGKDLIGLHQSKNPKEAIKNAEGLFVGGGNTFVLVSQLYKNDILMVIKEAIEQGTPYLGTSAGSNICGLTMHTTNDMPIMYPPSFKTLGLVPFNINPHYLDPDLNSEHMGETREQRIKEFHAYNTPPVVGLREGSYIKIRDNQLILKGKLNARIFEQNKAPYEVPLNTDLSHLK
ncbi:MAG: dipeptidase PepE [Winogradskyella sp.]|uniref:dipeptidase PepE n=1 Tax=Winogradskyella sp. TaxID=1883156 RepID=UPI0017E2BCB1|nr:dipeptidase PepE [Winogradskyella sp.]